MLALRRAGEHAAVGVCILAATVVASASCTKLDTSKAHRCVTDADCKAGRVCRANLCSPAAISDQRSQEAEKQDASTPRRTVQPSPVLDEPLDGDEGVPGTDEDAAALDQDAEAVHDDAAVLEQDSATVDRDAAAVEADAGTVDRDAAAVEQDGGAVDRDAAALAHGPDPSYPDGRSDLCAQEIAVWVQVVLWLYAGEGITADAQGRIRTWADRSHYRHNARSIGEDASLWPALVSALGTGHPSVRFGVVKTGTPEGHARRMSIADHASLRFGYGDFAIIAVLRYRNSAALEAVPHEIGALYLKQCIDCIGFQGAALFANDNWGPIIDGSATRSGFAFQVAAFGNYVTRTTGTGFNDDRIHVLKARRLGETLSIEVDERPLATTMVPAVDVSARGSDLIIGANHTSVVQALDGELFELMVIAGDAARDLSGLVHCLMAKYELQ